MYRNGRRAQLLLLLPVLAGCAQFTTSDDERARLQSAADAAGAAYVDCLQQKAAPYLGTGEGAESIVAVARKNCVAARDAAGQAQSALMSTRYIMSQREVDAALTALDARGEAAIAEQVLNRKAAAPATVAASAAPVPQAPAGGGDGYLQCMREQGGRWAAAQEPATVVAEAAHGRCASQLGDDAGRAEMEREGKALVVGIILDRKAAAPASPP